MKNVLHNTPEIYFIILAIMAGFSPPYSINPLFAMIIGIITLQLFIQNRIFGFILGGFLFLVNLLFAGAVLSEFHDVIRAQQDGSILLFTGLSIWLVNCIMSIFMLLKYYKKRTVPCIV